MHKSRFIFFCVIVLVLAGARTAKAQDGVDSLDDQIQNKYSEREPDKPATTRQQDKTKITNDDGHRKHWWSLPHFRHKKKDEKAAAHQPENKLGSKKVAAKPSNKTSVPRASGHTTASGRPQRTTVARKRNAHNPVASATPHKKTVSATSHARRPQHHDCSATHAKSEGCQAAQKHSGGTSTSRS